jgi:hypothetical protein
LIVPIGKWVIETRSVPDSRKIRCCRRPASGTSIPAALLGLNVVAVWIDWKASSVSRDGLTVGNSRLDYFGGIICGLLSFLGDRALALLERSNGCQRSN